MEVEVKLCFCFLEQILLLFQSKSKSKPLGWKMVTGSEPTAKNIYFVVTLSIDFNHGNGSVLWLLCIINTKK